jgi:hypothetical protein
MDLSSTSLDLVHDGGDVGRLAQGADLLGDDHDALAVGTKLVDRGIRQDGMEEAVHAVGQEQVVALDLVVGHQRLPGMNHSQVSKALPLLQNQSNENVADFLRLLCYSVFMGRLTSSPSGEKSHDRSLEEIRGHSFSKSGRIISKPSLS